MFYSDMIEMNICVSSATYISQK